MKLNSKKRERNSRFLRFESLELRELMANDLLASHNRLMPADVNGDNAASAIDVLIVTNILNNESNSQDYLAFRPDTNNDGTLSAADALVPINYINGAHGEGDTVRFRYEATGLDGNVKNSFGVGERFLLRGFVSDTRMTPSGVFSAYLDINFPTDRVSFDFREKQTVLFTGNPTGGNYRLAFNDGTTSATTPNITFTFSTANQDGSNVQNAERIQAALEALPNIGVGNVKVSPTPRVNRSYDIWFGGRFANTNVQTLTTPNVALTGGSNPAITVTETSGVDPGVATNSLGSIQFGVPTYVNGLSGALQPGKLDEVGAFDGQSPLGGDEFILFQVEMQATAVGQATISGEAADVSPQHDITIFGESTPVCPSVNSCTGSVNFGTLTITIANDVIAVTDSTTLDEDSAATAIDVLGNDQSVSGALSVTAITQGTAGGTVTVTNFSSDVSYQPAPNFFGVDTFTYTASNPTNVTSTATVTVTVREINDAPVANPDPNIAGFTTKQNTSQSFANVSAQLTANDNAGPGEGTQTLQVITIASPGSAGGTIQFSNNVANYTPASNFVGSETFTYTVQDNGTSRGNADPRTAQSTFTVVVADNNPPVANNDSFGVDEGTTDNSLNVLANDNGGVGEPNDVITITQVGTPTNGGAARIATDSRSILYTPNPSGVTPFSDTFTYTIRDQGGKTATATVTVDVDTPVRPRARNDNATISEGSGATSINVLANDLGNAGFPLRITRIVTSPLNGTAVIQDQGTPNTADDTISYTPSAQFAGVDSLVYEIDDDFVENNVSSQPSSATVNITVSAVNDAPVNTVPTAAITTQEDTSVNVTGLQVADIDAGTSTIEVRLKVNSGKVRAANTAGATVEGNDSTEVKISGTLTAVNAILAGTNISYTPNSNFNGTDALVMTADDRGNTGSPGPLTDSDTIAITVTAVNDAPALSAPASQVVRKNQPLVFSGSNAISVADVDSGASNVQLDFVAGKGTLSIGSSANVTVTGNGTANLRLVGPAANVTALLATGLTFQPNLNQTGKDAFVNVTASDLGNTGSGGAKTDSKAVAIEIMDFDPSRIAGSVYVDVNGNNRRDNDTNGDLINNDPEPGIVNVVIKLTGTDQQNQPISKETVTNVDGFFEFLDLVPGKYQIQQTQPANTVDGEETAGLGGTIKANDVIEFEIGEAGGIVSLTNEFSESNLTSRYAGLGIWDLLASSQDGTYRSGFTFGTNGVENWWALGEGWDDYTDFRIVVSPDESQITLTVRNIVLGRDETVVIDVDSARVRLRQFETDCVVRIIGTPEQVGLGSGSFSSSSSSSSEESHSSSAFADAVDSLFASRR